MTGKSGDELDKEIKERRAEIQRSERRVVQKEENLDKKLESIEKREAGFAAKEERQSRAVKKIGQEKVLAECKPCNLASYARSCNAVCISRGIRSVTLP